MRTCRARYPRLVQERDGAETGVPLLRYFRWPIAPPTRFGQGAYWVPIEGEWMAVPERAVIRDRGNPVGEAVVWYVHHRGSIIISCFVPADAV